MTHESIDTALEALPVGGELPEKPSEDLLVAENAPVGPVQEAVQQVLKRDTLDVLSRRIKGTSMLKTRIALLAGVPAVGALILTEGATYMSTSVYLASPAEMAAGALIAGTGYVGQRLREKGKLAKAAQAEHVIRDHLEESVDLIRGSKLRKQGAVLRWYGADSKFSKGEEIAGFAKVVEFAEQHNIPEIAASANLLRVVEKPVKNDYTKTTTPELLKQKKNVLVDDKKADEELLHLKTDEAKDLLEKLKAAGETTRTEALIRRLRQVDDGHPLLRAYDDWKRLNNSSELWPGVLRTARNTLERRLGERTTATAVRLPVRDEMGQLLTNVPHRIEPTISVRSNGARFTTMIEGDDGLDHTMEYQTLTDLVDGKDGMDAFIKDLLKKKHLSSDDLFALETALHHSLQEDNAKKIKRVIDVRTARADKMSQPQNQTLYERAVTERPRMRPTWLPKRGMVAKADQTIEYRRPRAKTLATKLGAFAAAAAMGGGLGWAADAAHLQHSKWEINCVRSDNVQYVDMQPPKIDQAACDANYSKLADVVASAVRSYTKGEQAYENVLILEAYQSGLLTPETIGQFSDLISRDWAQEKIDDLSSRFNLYGGSKSKIGDAKGGSGNPAIWSLDPQNGASTKGYWNLNVEDHMTIDPKSSGKMYNTPPLAGEVEMDEEPTRTTIVPMGTPVPEWKQEKVEMIRELQLPNQPPKSSEPLIGVSGRHLLVGGEEDLELVYYGLNAEESYDQSFEMALPVIQGGDIVAATIEVKDLGTDKVMRQVPNTIYQRSDGTFHLRVSKELTQGYLDIQYWVKPNANTALPLKAERPMTVQQVGESSRPLTEVLSAADVAPLLQKLNLPPNATLADAAKAIQASRGYSLTPYADTAKQKGEPAKVEGGSTRDMLLAVAKYAEDMKLADCNVAEQIELTLSRGQDSDSFMDAVDGFHNTDGDKILSQIESHAYPVTNKGEIIDPTPSLKTGQTLPPPQGYKNSPEVHTDTFENTIDIALDGLALVGGSFAGKKVVPAVAANTRRRRFKRALDSLPQTEEEIETFTIGAGIVNAVIHGNGTPVDEAAIARNTQPITMAKQRDASWLPYNFAQPTNEEFRADDVRAETAHDEWRILLKMRTLLPDDQSAKNVLRTIRERQKDGSLRMSGKTARALGDMLKHAEVIRAHSFEKLTEETESKKPATPTSANS